MERETMELDVLIVGGGAAGLSCALRLAQLGAQAGAEMPSIGVLEKASEVGGHSLSGAVLNPVALRELLPDYQSLDCPIECRVTKDDFYYLTRSRAIRSPVTPPPFHNEGHLLISLSRMNRWLGQQCEQAGVSIFPGFAAVEALYEGDRVVGVRTGDKGRDKSGEPKSNFEPGMDLKAKITVFAEGTRGSLFKQVSKRCGLAIDSDPDVYEEGVKEVIQCLPGTVTAGHVIHTLGFPLSKSIGGTFIYTLPHDRIVLGLVGFLDTADPLFDPHRELQRLKTHPFIHEMIKGGRVIAYGGKTLPAGGWYSMPRLYHDGMMVVGDSAMMVDVKRLKGIHLAMKSGMLAAETAMEALRVGDSSSKVLSGYSDRVRESFIGSELRETRNFHQTLSLGLFPAAPLIALQELTGGRGLIDRPASKIDLEHTEPVLDIWGPDGLSHEDVQLPTPDGVLFFDKLGSVFLTGTSHDEDSPNHLHVANRDTCADLCHEKYNSPCNHFCPAKVYEMVPENQSGSGRQVLQVNYTNCIHCKTCDIKCPFDNISWTAPEGGGGPRYSET